VGMLVVARRATPSRRSLIATSGGRLDGARMWG